MALNFPSEPTVDQVYVLGTKSWTWNGAAWMVVPSNLAGNQDYGLITGSVTGTIDYGALS